MVNLFVILPAHLDPEQYRKNFEAGKSADSSPWGFAHAEKFGHSVRFSHGRVRNIPERVLRRIFSFDLWHGLVNRQNMLEADYVISHTEQEYLGAAFALRLSRGKRKPVLQGNTLWLFHEFRNLFWLRRLFVRWLLGRVDLLTCNASPNVEMGAGLGYASVRYVPYGISVESFPITEPTARTGNLVASIGTDRSRDWLAVAEVARQRSDLKFRAATGVNVAELNGLTNVEVRPTRGVAETNELYDQARAVLICLTPNSHASGITVILEAVARGVPVVCTCEGGLSAYFGADELWYYGQNCTHKTALEALDACLADPVAAAGRAKAAQDAFLRNRYDSIGFIERLLTEIGLADAK